MEFLEAKHVTFRYFEHAKHNILDDASLTIHPGTITVISGNSGCGKSTMAAVCAGLYPENGGELLSGEITLCGQKIQDLTPLERSRYLSLMFQNPELQFCMDTLRKELRFCLENQKADPKEMDGVIESFAEEFSIQALLDRPFHTLSGGEKQKAALCCLLSMHSQGILLDEPFANIDPSGASEIISLLKEQNRLHGTTIIVIDHQPAFWADVADEYILLGSGGQIIERGSRYPVNDYPKQQQLSPLHIAICLDDVAIYSEKKTPALLEHLSSTFSYGQMCALTGASGSGKTTLFYTLLKQKPYNGAIEIDGQNLKNIKEKDLFRKIGMVFQNPSQQFTTTNVLDEVMENIKMWHGKQTETQMQAMAQELLSQYGLWAYRRYSPYMLSQGQQRRLAVLSALCGGQKILLLDEPTYGQDAVSTRIIMDQLRQKVIADGLCVIFSTHDLKLADAYADQIYRVMEGGLES